ncbi:uncharacterized protein LOC119353544 isoform X2 [Triticum dicoccoides]|uniref:uncharacterized protein LOC119353544 isoform X2 n=1 Tax=Triticum dicoccoides TaxID=85692 RepID=UPI00188F2D70|nr:uncharacterized protein LOC119353544 isoform X2 [Triticum dicoccoides]
MGGDYVVMPILLCFLFRTCQLTLANSIDLDGNLAMDEKNTTLLRHKSFHFPWRANIKDEGSDIISHYAIWHTKPGIFYGLRAEMSIWASPNQENSQESGASLQIYCQDGGNYNLIQAGFHISPSLYHNKDIRFFTYWTKDLKSRGCYNLKCPGFVSARGANLDPNSEDWVVYRHDLEKPSLLGHFPKKLCPGIPRIQALTGFVNYFKNAHGPPMGSGHFPNYEDHDDKKSAYFRRIRYYTPNGRSYNLFGVPMVKLLDRLDCYRANGLVFDYKRGFMFNYGGPSGCVG